jgi:hypothetical protein
MYDKQFTSLEWDARVAAGIACARMPKLTCSALHDLSVETPSLSYALGCLSFAHTQTFFCESSPEPPLYLFHRIFGLDFRILVRKQIRNAAEPGEYITVCLCVEISETLSFPFHSCPTVGLSHHLLGLTIV